MTTTTAGGAGAWHGRHVLVTGGSGGLGPAVVEAFVAAGATVHLPGAVATGAHALPRVDLTDDAAVVALFASLPPLWASVHVAGGFLWRSLLEASLAELRSQLDVNLATAFLCTREAGKNMRGRGGRIVNVASRAAETPGAGHAVYAPAKAAVVALTKAAALELRGEGVLVNAVAPTIIDTPANRRAMPDARHDRWARPDQVARTILWLASPVNELTTGAVLPVGGTE